MKTEDRTRAEPSHRETAKDNERCTVGKRQKKKCWLNNFVQFSMTNRWGIQNNNKEKRNGDENFRTNSDYSNRLKNLRKIFKCTFCRSPNKGLSISSVVGMVFGLPLAENNIFREGKQVIRTQ